MHFLNHSLSHYFSKAVHHRHPESSVLYHTSPLNEWPSELIDKADRFVEKIESCSAHTMTSGHGQCPPTVDRDHYHTFLRVTVAQSGDHPEEVVFVERAFQEQGKAMHSVIPVAEEEMSPSRCAGASLDEDTFHDRACIIIEGSPAALIHTHHIKVDRMVKFTDCPDRRLSLYELATVLRFISARGLRSVSMGLGTACETYSRWFCRATLSALAPVIMRGAFRHMTPGKGLAATQIEIAMQRSVDAWLNTSFKAYPLEEVASENLTRQLAAMSDEERATKMVQISKRKEELAFKAMVNEAYQARKVQIKLTQQSGL